LQGDVVNRCQDRSANNFVESTILRGIYITIYIALIAFDKNIILYGKALKIKNNANETRAIMRRIEISDSRLSAVFNRIV
jgi:cytochrome c-type biogenesis protein CcmE